MKKDSNLQVYNELVHICEIETELISVPPRQGRMQTYFHEKGVIYRRDGCILHWVGKLDKFVLPMSLYISLD